MKLANLSPDILEKIKTYRYDQLAEKHEGPWDWAGVLKHKNTEILTLEGRFVLLPVNRKQIPNISLVRLIPSVDGRTLTLFLKDTSYNPMPQDDLLTGRVAICDKIPDTELYVAVFYHEWFVVKNENLP